MKTKTPMGMLGVVLVTALTMSLGTPAVGAVVADPAVPSGPNPGACSGPTHFAWPGFGYNQHKIGTIVSVANGNLPTSRTISAAVPAGEYSVDVVTYDGYPSRAASVQPFEILHYEFLDAAGLIIATTGDSADLLDGVIEDTWAGNVGTVVLDRPATKIRAQHTYPFHTVPDTANSVMPVCISANLVVPPTTTTTAAPTTTTAAPTTTTAAPTTTTAAPTTTTAAPTTTTAAPTTTTAAPPTTTAAPPTTAAPTTTVPTEVLPAVEVAQPATPTDGNPTFTG